MTPMQHSEESGPKRHKPSQDEDIKVSVSLHNSCIDFTWKTNICHPFLMSSQEPLHVDDVSPPAEVSRDRHHLSIETRAQIQEAPAPAATTPNDFGGAQQGEAPGALSSTGAAASMRALAEQEPFSVMSLLSSQSHDACT